MGVCFACFHCPPPFFGLHGIAQAPPAINLPPVECTVPALTRLHFVVPAPLQTNPSVGKPVTFTVTRRDGGVRLPTRRDCTLYDIRSSSDKREERVIAYADFSWLLSPTLFRLVFLHLNTADVKF